MHIFDDVRVQNLDRRQFQLTVLASMAILVLATGVAILMYPAVFSQDILVSRQTFQFAFYGFCCLSRALDRLPMGSSNHHTAAHPTRSNGSTANERSPP